ncbi:MAG: thiamine pyrophosphate-binding protein [Candidatus Methanomethylophilus sp.]|jgi:acetolactate synthase-1/2/3 large subunit|nr:thiamine pyrophosphate-binding protein [Methanomethylophilus sp.]MCI2092333.1 thiamine pyrophosphate-binding protein [Methanomethylophilus sp.]
MKMRVSDYIASLCRDAGITDAFTVVGGGSMWMNNAFAHCKGINVVYNHHEQASAIAAEAYARINNKLAVLCVTTGPGGTNAITGVVGGWLDSIPMIVFSGQVRYATMARSTGLPLRSMGDQEFDITKAIGCMTKYCELILDPKKIKYCVRKALFIATHGRPGPCWIDVPLDVQNAEIETDGLEDFDPSAYMKDIPMFVDPSVADRVIELVSKAKRPVFYAGNGIRLSGGYDAFLKVIEKLNIPVVTCWDSVDLIPDDHRLYGGRGGNLGDRGGNFAVQNSDLVLSIGSRLSFRQTGFNYETWARKAYVIMEDIDAAELKKPNVHVDLPVHADAKAFLQVLLDRAGDKVCDDEDWIARCKQWQKEYPVVRPEYYKEEGPANPYCFMKELSRRLPEGTVTVVGNGTACAVGSHAYVIKKGTRFIVNSAIASMGYDLPAAIGACVAIGRKPLVCIAGDGSLMMNLQELQTVITNRLPIKLFIINNSGYQSMRLTETNLFNADFFGMGPESGDLGFPPYEKLAAAFGYPYYSVKSNAELSELDRILSEDAPFICEVFVTTKQAFEPKSSTKVLEDGTLYSAPLEDMYPFLSRDELKKNMYIE